MIEYIGSGVIVTVLSVNVVVLVNMQFVCVNIADDYCSFSIGKPPNVFEIGIIDIAFAILYNAYSRVSMSDDRQKQKEEPFILHLEVFVKHPIDRETGARRCRTVG